MQKALNWRWPIILAQKLHNVTRGHRPWWAGPSRRQDNFVFYHGWYVSNNCVGFFQQAPLCPLPLFMEGVPRKLLRSSLIALLQILPYNIPVPQKTDHHWEAGTTGYPLFIAISLLPCASPHLSACVCMHLWSLVSYLNCKLFGAQTMFCNVCKALIPEWGL